jgi:Ca-activated chloride channel family protein
MSYRERLGTVLPGSDLVTRISMRRQIASCLLLCLPLSLLTFCGIAESPQTSANSAPSYTLQVSVDEISLTFHAFDARGTPLTHLTPSDLRLSDEGKPPSRIVMLRSSQDLPIRVGFLVDKSASMRANLAANRSIISLYASRLIRKGFDRAFVMQVDMDSLIMQQWTDDRASIAAGTAAIPNEEGNRPFSHFLLTAIFDSLYIACRDQWSQERGVVTGNFILLFTDGEDDASHVYMNEAIDMCQRTRTAIYIITNSPKSRFSDGQRTLEKLAKESGGRVFFNPQSDQVWEDLQLIEAEQRNQYQLVYKPSGFKPNGAFHRVKLDCSVKGAQIIAPSGYYAFARQYDPQRKSQPQ